MKDSQWARIGVVLLVASAGAGCSGGGSGGGEARPSRNTANYLLSAIDRNNFFRWTRTPGLSDTRIYIEVHDTDLPSSERAKHRDFLVEARSKWKSALNNAGFNVQSSTRFISESPPWPSSYCVLKVYYRDTVGSKAGTVRHISAGGNKVDYVEMKLALRNPTTGKLFGDASLRATVLHEMGHAMGIYDPGPGEAHSSDEGDAMYGNLRWKWSSLARGDEAAVRQLYTMTPTLVREDG